MDDRVLVYRGADQPDMSVINPESDVWQHIRVGLAHQIALTMDSERLHLHQLAIAIR